MIGRIAAVLGGEILLLAGASMAHAGLLPVTQAHARAAIAEAVIAFALALGLAACLIRPDVTRPAALASQAFALLGTLVGGLTILIGVGPQTIEDKAFHILLLAILAFGLIDAAGLRVPPKGQVRNKSGVSPSPGEGGRRTWINGRHVFEIEA